MQGLEVPKSILSAWNLSGCTVSPLGSGLINRTWLVSDGDQRRYVLQQVNPIFPGAINEDIRVVTAHLRARGLVAPELRRWRDRIGELSGVLPVLAGSGATWFVPGKRDDALASLRGEGVAVVVARTVPG